MLLSTSQFSMPSHTNTHFNIIYFFSHETTFYISKALISTLITHLNHLDYSVNNLNLINSLRYDSMNIDMDTLVL